MPVESLSIAPPECGSSECRNFRAILEANPEIGHHVHSLSLVDGSLHSRDSRYWVLDEVENLSFILGKLPHLQRFSLSKYWPIQISNSNINWATFPEPLLQAFLGIFRLPSLWHLDLTHGFTFHNAEHFFQTFPLDSTSNIRSLAISCMNFHYTTIVEGKLLHRRQSAPAKLDYLELNYVGSTDEGPQLVKVFSHPCSPFDISTLKHLVITGINEEDLWISCLLNMQRKPKELQELWLHGIFRTLDLT